MPKRKIERPILLLACTHSLGAKFLQGQLAFMKANGFNVFVLSAPGKEIEELCEKEGSTFVSFPFRRDISPINDFVSVIKLRKMLKDINPTIINAGTPKAGLLVCLASKIAGLHPILFTLRGLRSETLTGFKKALVKGMETFTCTLADIVIPISPSLSAHAQQNHILSEKKAVVLGSGSSNGVDIEKFTPRLTHEEKQQIRKEIGLGRNDFVISYVGRINNDKGVVELFRVFKQLVSHFANAKLLIVGKFENEDAIPDNVRTEMETHPSVILENYREDIRTIYEIIDLLVLYSRREGFGNILTEASCMKVPVIASNIPGCKDAVKHGVSGYLVNSEEELFERLNFYLTHMDSAKNDGEKGRTWIKENFDSHIIWSKQLELYNKLLTK